MKSQNQFPEAWTWRGMWSVSTEGTEYAVALNPAQGDQHSLLTLLLLSRTVWHVVRELFAQKKYKNYGDLPLVHTVRWNSNGVKAVSRSPSSMPLARLNVHLTHYNVLLSWHLQGQAATPSSRFHNNFIWNSYTLTRIILNIPSLNLEMLTRVIWKTGRQYQLPEALWI